MKTASTKPRYGWLLILIGSIIPITLILGQQFGIPHRFTVPLIVVVMLILATTALWAHAKAKATGEEWWQDESSLGWRGY